MPVGDAFILIGIVGAFATFAVVFLVVRKRAGGSRSSKIKSPHADVMSQVNKAPGLPDGARRSMAR